MNFRVAMLFFSTALIVSACEGDSRPFTEAVEVRTLNLVDVEVLAPHDTLEDLYLNINQGLQLSVRGISGVGERIALPASKRSWSVSDTSVASISENGYLQALTNGFVDVSLVLGGIESVGFGVTVADATLVSINPISGKTTLERCWPERYFATGTFSDNTSRNLDNLTWVVSHPANARIFERSGKSIKLNALEAMDQLTLTVAAPGGQVLDQPLIVSNTLERISIRPVPIILDVGDERQALANGHYAVSTGETAMTTRILDITENVEWAVVTGTDNLSVSNVVGTKGLLTGLNADGDVNITAACGSESDRVLVDVNLSDTSTSTQLAFKVGDQLVIENQVTVISRSANSGGVALRASTGSEYDVANDVTSDIDFKLQESTSALTGPISIGGSTSAPTIQLNALGTAIIVATEKDDGETVYEITIRVDN